jgi:subtilisin family serine protease
MVSRRTVALAVALFSAALPASAAAAPPAVSGRLIVGFEKGVSKDRQGQLLAALGGKVERRLGAVRGATVRPRGGLALKLLRKRLSEAKGVAYAEPDYYQFTSARTPTDPFYTLDWALIDSPEAHDISAPEAWGTRTSCAKVAILDTGIDTDHPDLKANVYKSADKPNNGKDDDKNGWVDDTYGLNVIAGKGSGEDDNGHGSHVSGIVGARAENGVGIAGTCWSTQLLAVKFMNARGKGSTSDAIAGIDYAVKQGFKIINSSFGSSASSESLKNAVEYAKKKGVLLVVAAGNDGVNIDKTPEYPAAYGDSNILTVAATTDDDVLASFSNFGSKAVDLAAPGDDIFSTYLGGGYKNLSGTSMASPYVAGVAALLRKQDPNASYSDLRSAIKKHVDKPPGLSGKVATNGRLNAAKALAGI